MNIDKYDSKEKVYKFLQEHAVAVLSTVSLDNIPSAAPIYFVPDEELNLYFMTKSDTVKAQNIENSDNDSAVAITVVDPEFPLTVQARGTISENNDPKYFGKLTELNALQKAGFHWPPPLSKIQSEGFLLFYKFTPTWLRIADFSETGGGSSRPGTSLFHQIIPA